MHRCEFRGAEITPSELSPSRETVATNLGNFKRSQSRRRDLKPSAVALCIGSGASGLDLLMTRRSRHLRSHAGQWALPGGRLDLGESAELAALRELREETGLQCEISSVLGLLDDYMTRSGYVITPVVVWSERIDGAEITSPAEVEEIFPVSVAGFDVEPRFVFIPESDRPVIQLPLLGRHIHAPTAAILHQFCEVALHARHTRVAHFEQPMFSWR